MDGTNVLGSVEISLIGREDGEHAAHDGEGDDGGGAEASEVDGSEGAGGVGHALVDEEGEPSIDGDGHKSEHLEGVPPANLVRHGRPTNPPAKVAPRHGHQVSRGKAGGDQEWHGVREHVLYHGLGDGHEAHPAGGQQGGRAPQQPELGGLQQAVHWNISTSTLRTVCMYLKGRISPPE